MKSSMTFIQVKRCIERENYNFKSREVKRLKECALALMKYELRHLKSDRRKATRTDAWNDRQAYILRGLNMVSNFVHFGLPYMMGIYCQQN